MKKSRVNSVTLAIGLIFIAHILIIVYVLSGPNREENAYAIGAALILFSVQWVLTRYRLNQILTKK